MKNSLCLVTYCVWKLKFVFCLKHQWFYVRGVKIKDRESREKRNESTVGWVNFDIIFFVI